MSARLPRCLVLLAAAALALAATGCGNKKDVVTHAETEGIYVDVGPLTYQVQLSRPLNPRSREDRAYVQGLPPTEAPLGADETWFGVWMRVDNETDDAHMATKDFEIADTAGVEYKPVGLASSNVFAYRPALLEPGGVLPAADTAAAESPIQGSLLLFRLKLEALQNRPLELKIEGLTPPREATVDLDV